MKNRSLLNGIGAVLLLSSAFAEAATPWNAETHHLAFGDFNGDNRTDLLYIAKSPSLHSGIALSDGTSPSIDLQSWPSNYKGIAWHSSVYLPIVADFDGDGRDDVLMHRQSAGEHYLFFTNALGQISTIGQTIGNNLGNVSWGWGGDEHRIVAGNFDGIGGADIFLQAVKKEGVNAVFLSNTSGHFTALKQSWPSTDMGFRWSFQHSIVHAGDFDGDGRDDLFVQTKPDIVLIDYEVPFPVPTYKPNSFGIVNAKFEDGLGRIFREPVLHSWNRNHLQVDWSASNSNAIVGDFNNDGRTDIFLQARSAGQSNRLMVASSSGQFNTADLLVDTTLRAATGDQYRLHAANIDGVGGTGLYLQARTATGTNHVASTTTGSTFVVAVHDPGVMGVGAPLAGRTETSFDVSQTGEASYSIPIFAPPGTHGMTPSVSFDYSHRGGGTLLGAGWGLAGLSSITRCSKTWAQDGEVTAVSMDADDRYCLDGNRLRAISGTYSQGGAEYRTEIETYSRIISSGAVGVTGIASFTVETKDGRILEFGTAEDSRIQELSSTTVRVWALSQIRDREGNSILFDYYEDAINGSYRIKSIRYTRNLEFGLTPAYKIEFFYETKPLAEIDVSYFAGNVVRETTRLRRVDVTYNSALVRRYFVRYEPALSSAGQSRVQSIQECAGPEVRCYPATTFTWQDGSVGLSDPVTSSATQSGLFTSAIPADINGDGISDTVYDSNGSLHFMLGTSTGAFAAPVNTGINVGAYATSYALPMDYNADGREDILIPLNGSSSSTWHLIPGSATGLGTQFNTNAPYPGLQAGDFQAVDVNGDGLRDVTWMLRTQDGYDTVYARLRIPGGNFELNTITLFTNFGEGWEIGFYATGTRRFHNLGRNPDWNGDGRDDFMINVRYEDPTPTVLTHVLMMVSGVSGAQYGDAFDEIDLPYIIDVNGDGYTDILFSQYNQWFYAINTGGGFDQMVLLGTTTNLQRDTGLVIDWDSDGNEDFLVRNSNTGTWFIWRSNGEQLLPAVDTFIAYTGGWVGDANGDGIGDIIYKNGSQINARMRVGVQPDLLDTATDSFGNVANFDYLPISQGGHVRSTGGAFPEVDWQGPINVVSQLTASNGIGANYSLAYTYGGARMNLQGREFQGFDRKTTVDSRDGIYTHEFFKQEFPYTGMPRRVEVRRPNNGALISTEVIDYLKHDLGSGASARSHPYAHVQTTQEYAVGGAADTLLVRTVATTNVVSSAHGSVTDSTQVTTEAATANGLPANQNQTWTERKLHTAMTNETSGGRWCIGRPTATQQLNKHDLYGGTEKVRNISLGWNLDYCRLTQTKMEPGSAIELTTDLRYDSFGNVDRETVSGSGIATRISEWYWGTTGQFPRTRTNALSQVTTFEWDAANAVLTGETDPNGLTTQPSHDAFGRTTQVIKRDGTRTRWSYDDCSASAVGCPTAQSRLVVRQSEHDINGLEYSETATVLDRFGRNVVQRIRKADGSYSRTDVEYDALGRTYRESFPCSWSSCSQKWRTYNYDLLSRVSSTSQPIAETGIGVSTTTITYGGLTTRFQDSLLKDRFITRNATGQIVKSQDMNGYSQSFDRDPFGLLVRVTDSQSTVLQSFDYNQRGMLILRSDMDAGVSTFIPNALGQVTSQTDAKNRTAVFAYDLLGRLRTRTDNSVLMSDFVWGSSAAAKNIGQLEYMTGPGYREDYSYDSKGRRMQTKIAADGTDYYYNYEYNDLGSLRFLTYPASVPTNPGLPARLKVQYGYSFGELTSIRDADAASGAPNLWTLNAVNDRGQVTQETLGSGATTTRDFDDVTGLVASIQTSKSGYPGIQHNTYEWDTVGNLTQRKDILQSPLTENFYYDNLHRLDYSTVTGVSGNNLDLDYDALGNITNKSDTGTYSYHPAKKHQVSAIDRPGPDDWSFSYDANGNMTQGRGATLEWTTDDLPASITKGNAPNDLKAEFQYTPDRRYWKQVARFSNDTATTLYLGGLLEKVTSSSGTEFRHTVPAGGTKIIVTRGGGDGTYYVTADHLGSFSTITDNNGAVVVNQSYGAFGKRRGANWQGSPTQDDLDDIADVTRRGFTGHTMLDNLGLIHMNGRMYDSETARFASADPYIPDPLSTQEYNRYSYVSNNPLTYVDPSGFSAQPMQCDHYGCDGPSWDSAWTFQFTAPMMRYNPAAYALAYLRDHYVRSCYAYCRRVREIFGAGTIVNGPATPAKVESSMRPTSERKFIRVMKRASTQKGVPAEVQEYYKKYPQIRAAEELAWKKSLPNTKDAHEELVLGFVKEGAEPEIRTKSAPNGSKSGFKLSEEDVTPKPGYKLGSVWHSHPWPASYGTGIRKGPLPGPSDLPGTEEDDWGTARRLPDAHHSLKALQPDGTEVSYYYKWAEVKPMR
jgi:RHS repeat-associated protein